MTFGEKIAKARKDHKLTQEQLAGKLEVSSQAVSAWEHDDYLPDTKKLLLLRDMLGLSLDILFASTENDWKSCIFGQHSLIERAIEFAAVKHAGSFRKGTSIPYITHVIEALAIVSTLTDDEEVRAAAVLHDTLEDTETTEDDLIKNFGERVATLVADESENKREDKPAEETWQIRKQETLDHLEGTSPEARMIALGDKLSNIRAIRRDYEQLGEDLWQRFNQHDPALHGWFYRSIAGIFGRDENLNQTAAYQEYAQLVSDVFSRYPDPEEQESLADKEIELRCLYTDFADDVREELPEGATPWSLILDRPEDEEMAELHKMAMVLDAFLRTDSVGFGNVHLIIVNDPDSDDVSWERTDDGYKIHLCAESGWHWCQVAYQMGYALMHCLIDHVAEGEQIDWAEELICETAALELLYRLQQCWSMTPFGKEDPEYADCLDEYIQQNMEDKGTSALLRCKDRDELIRINQKNDFTDRLDESHDLFNLINGHDLVQLAQIRKYAADDLLLHTHYWRSHSDGSRAVDYICRIQERIPDCEVPSGISQEINLIDSRPTEAQLRSFEYMIRGLRDLPYEHIMFTFMDPDKKDCEQMGLVFYQLIRGEEGSIIAEIRLDTKEGRKMYGLRTDEDQTIAILNQIIIMDEVPDLSGWQDITDSLF